MIKTLRDACRIVVGHDCIYNIPYFIDNALRWLSEQGELRMRLCNGNWHVGLWEYFGEGIELHSATGEKLHEVISLVVLLIDREDRTDLEIAEKRIAEIERDPGLLVPDPY